MDPSMLLAATQQASQTKTDLLNLGVSLWQSKKNRDFAEEQSQLSYERALDMWNKSNEYNTPTAQMGRLAEAGLNPNLIYGNINNMPAAKSPDYQPAKSDIDLAKLSTPTAVQTFQTARMNEAQIRNMELQNELIAQRTKHESAKKVETDVKTLMNAMGLYTQYGVYHERIRDTEGDVITPRDGYMWQTDKSIKEHQLQRLKNELLLQVQKWDETELDINWKILKNYMMDNYSINIDRDSSLERKGFAIIDWILRLNGTSLSQIGGEVLNYE